MKERSDIITMKDLAYAELIRKIDVIYDYVTVQLERYRDEEDQIIVDSHDVTNFLKISLRTLQRRVKDGDIPHYKDGANLFFVLGDIKKAVRGRILKTSQSNLQRLINKHRYYGYKRSDTL